MDEDKSQKKKKKRVVKLSVYELLSKEIIVSTDEELKIIVQIPPFRLSE